MTVMEINKNVDNKNASKPKKLKLSSSLAGQAESKSKKSWQKLKVKKSQQKKRRDRPFASAVRSVSNRSGVPTVTIGIVPPTSNQPSTVPYPHSALPFSSSAASIPALNFGLHSTGASRTNPGSLASVSSLFTNMSLDRSMRRKAGAWNSSDSFVNDSFGSYNEQNGEGGGLYTDFSQDWADPRGTPPYMNRTAANNNPYRWASDQQNWQQGGSRKWHGGGGGQGRYWNGNFRGGQMPGRFSHQGWSSWGPDDHDWPQSEFLRPQSTGSGNQTRPSRSHTHWDQAPDQSFTERGAQNNQWQNLTKHFGSSHFHREGPNGQELSDGLHAPQADSSGLEDSGSSGGGRKRPRSFDRGGQLSKSSRAERFTSRYHDGYSPNSSKALSVSDLIRPEVQKPDSTSKQGNGQKSQTTVAKGSKSVNGSGVKTGGSGSKKKQTAFKHKMAPSSSVSGSKAADGVSKTNETDEANPGEGILERAERICKELREKRKAVPSRANLSAQRVGALRSVVLNTSVRRFNLAHKSFLKGYMSDSNSTTNKPTSGDMTADSATQKKHVSSSVNSDMEQSTRSQGSTATSVDSGADTATSSSTKSSQHQGGDIERIRQSIESSVMAEKRARRTSVRERSLSGSRSPAVSVSSTAVHSAAASSVMAGTSAHASKPPLPLSKDALAKMVNAPRSRTQRLQLARILRQHSATTIIRPRRIQLDGLYDSDDGDSIGDVLKNISGLEEIGECAELSKIKLEDLTYEDKLQIAQMIEEADSTNRNSSTDVIELGEQRSVQRRSRPPHRIRLSSSERINQGPESSGANPRSASADRVQASSPSPSRPLSLDDLNTEDRSRQEDSADIVSLHPRSADVCPSSSTATTLRSASPARAALAHSSSPRLSRTSSQSPGRSAGAGDSLDLPSTSDAVDTSGQDYQASGDALAEHTSRQALPTPMDISDPPASSNPAGRSSSQEAGVLYEVMGLCKRQDSILSEMRCIDNELCDMYKSLIEVVARMSGLQRRRVQLQTEGEQLSQRRNDLLHGLYPNTAVSLDKGPLSSAQEERQQRVSSDPDANLSSMPLATDSSVQSSRRSSVVEMSDQAPSGPSVVLPSWLRTAASSRSVSLDREGSRQETTPSVSDHRSDICLSGSVSSSVGTTLSQSTSLNNSMDSVREVAPRHLSAPSAKRSSSDVGERAGRVMLSITGAVDSTMDRGATSSVSSVSTEASHSVVKNRMGADSSSGIGSSVSAHSNFRKSLGSPLSDSGSHQNLSSTQSSQEEHSKSAQPPESSRLVIHSFQSPKLSNVKNTSSPNVNHPKSPGVSVAYLGALTSDLVQQIVRNLPLTSQLGEVNKPSMYVVRQENSAMHIPSENRSQDAGTKSTSADNSVAQPRTRTISVHSVSSDLSSGEQIVTASIPPLKLCEDSDKAGSKTGTPRSESDTHSVTSGTSLGEQIKLFSERNSFSLETPSSLSTLPCVTTNQGEDSTTTSKSVQEMRDCSVLLERLDMDSITIIPESWKAEEEMDRRRKRKSRKDRDQSLQRRRRYVTDSSSGGEDGEITPVGDGYHNVASSTPQPDPSDLLDGVEKMEADCGPEEDLNSTLVESIEQPPSDEEVGSTQPANATFRAVSPSRLKLNPENLKAFRANIRRNMSPSPAREASMESTGANQADVEERVASKEILKISGPCAPVSGLCVHNNLLYACFHRIGVHSYTLTGELSAEYPTADAHCFTITPVGSGSQHYLAVGCADRLTFLSINDQSVVSNLDTVVKVMCVQVVDTTLFAGLDTGAIIVISLTTLQETRRFQASDCPVQCMSWTREGSTRLLTVASQDASIHVIDASSGLPVRIISGHTKTAFSLCMVDHIVLSGSGDRKVMAHNVHNASLMWELHDHKGIITSVCVDNGLLFTAGYDKIIRCYDLKSRKLLHLMYGAGRCVIMKMAIHNSILYTGNRDGEIEAIDLRDMGSFVCECVSCSMVYGLQEHLWHHLVTDHLLPNTQAMRCPWSDCAVVLDTRSSPEKAGEHLHQHINVSH